MIFIMLSHVEYWEGYKRARVCVGAHTCVCVCVCVHIGVCVCGLIPYVILLQDSSYPPWHSHFCSFQQPFLSPRHCPGIVSAYNYYFYYGFVCLCGYLSGLLQCL